MSIFTRRATGDDLRLREVVGHLTFTAADVTAWYLLPETVWHFRPDAPREAWLELVARQYAGLAGCRLHLRRTTAPYPVRQWATNLWRTSVPAVNDEQGLAMHLRRAAAHLEETAPHEGFTMLGVTIARRSINDRIAEALGRLLRKPGTSRGERARIAEKVAGFTELLAPAGLRARPATPEQLAWLLYRSIGLGLTPPDLMVLQPGPDDIMALTEHIDRERTPYGSTVKLINRQTGEESHVAILTVGQMEPQITPEVHDPWLALDLPFPVEVSCRVDVLPPDGPAAKQLEHRLAMITSQISEHAEHGMPVPPHLERARERALEVADQVRTGRPELATSIHGWHRFAIAAPTTEGALDRAAQLRRLYYEHARISVQHPKLQEPLAREFIPGEPIGDRHGYVRRLPVDLWAAAVPTAAARVGDHRGDLIGFTQAGGNRPVMLDLHYPMEIRQRSGLVLMVAEPGGGKSTLLGSLAYLNARRGVITTLVDPSGPLAKLATMPELAPYTQVLNLTGAQPGTLAPYGLVPDPQPDPALYESQTEYDNAFRAALTERRALVTDVVMMLLPPEYEGDKQAMSLLREALRIVPNRRSSTLEQVIDALRGLEGAGFEGRNLANLLADAAEYPSAQLFFGRPAAIDTTATLLVITMSGLPLPRMNTSRVHWSTEEKMALPMLHCAHRLAVARTYRMGRDRRKFVGLDEAHVLNGWSSGRELFDRISRDSRKWNLAAVIASQNPRDILGLDLLNLVTTVFVGRIVQDQEIAAEALRLLQIPTGEGYEAVLGALSYQDPNDETPLGYREFVMRDVDGRVQKIRIDVSWVPGLLAALDTNPPAPLALASTAPAPALFGERYR